MKKLIAFCLITILMLSSGCIGWADSNPSISSLGEPYLQVSEELNTNSTELEKLTKPEESISVKTLIKPLEPDNPDEPGGIENQLPLLINTIGINLGDLQSGSTFTKTITINNPNTKTAYAYMAIKNKQNISNISVTPSNLKISSNSSGKVTIKGTVPSSGNYQATLEIANSLNTHVATCLIYGASDDRRPKNVKVTYSSESEDYTITWDAMDENIDHYNVYAWNGSWGLMAEVNETKFVRHYIALEVAKDLRIMVRGVDSNGTITNGTEAKWDGVEDEEDEEDTGGVVGVPNKVRNFRVYYHFEPNNYPDGIGWFYFKWDEPIGGADFYRIKIKENHETWSISCDGTSEVLYNEMNYVQTLPVETTFTIEAWNRTEYLKSEPVIAPCLPGPHNVSFLYNSSAEELKMTWENEISSIEKFMVYSSYDGSEYQLVQQSNALSYTKQGVKVDDVRKYKFMVVSANNSGARGEEKEINFKDFSLTYEYLSQPKSLSANYNQENCEIDLNWSSIPGAEKYYIYMAVNGGEYFLRRTPALGTQHVISAPLLMNKTYSFIVRASNVYDTDVEDNIASVYVYQDPDNPNPDVPNPDDPQPEDPAPDQR